MKQRGKVYAVAGIIELWQETQILTMRQLEIIQRDGGVEGMRDTSYFIPLNCIYYPSPYPYNPYIQTPLHPRS